MNLDYQFQWYTGTPSAAVAFFLIFSLLLFQMMLQISWWIEVECPLVIPIQRCAVAVAAGFALDQFLMYSLSPFESVPKVPNITKIELFHLPPKERFTNLIDPRRLILKLCQIGDWDLECAVAPQQFFPSLLSHSIPNCSFLSLKTILQKSKNPIRTLAIQGIRLSLNNYL